MDDSKERRRISKAMAKKTLLGIILNLPGTKCTKRLKSLHLEVCVCVWGGGVFSKTAPHVEPGTDLTYNVRYSSMRGL